MWIQKQTQTRILLDRESARGWARSTLLNAPPLPALKFMLFVAPIRLKGVLAPMLVQSTHIGKYLLVGRE